MFIWFVHNADADVRMDAFFSRAQERLELFSARVRKNGAFTNEPFREDRRKKDDSRRPDERFLCIEDVAAYGRRAFSKTAGQAGASFKPCGGHWNMTFGILPHRPRLRFVAGTLRRVWPCGAHRRTPYCQSKKSSLFSHEGHRLTAACRSSYYYIPSLKKATEMYFTRLPRFFCSHGSCCVPGLRAFTIKLL